MAKPTKSHHISENGPVLMPSDGRPGRIFRYQNLFQARSSNPTHPGPSGRRPEGIPVSDRRQGFMLAEIVAPPERDRPALHLEPAKLKPLNGGMRQMNPSGGWCGGCLILRWVGVAIEAGALSMLCRSSRRQWGRAMRRPAPSDGAVILRGANRVFGNAAEHVTEPDKRVDLHEFAGGTKLRSTAAVFPPLSLPKKSSYFVRSQSPARNVPCRCYGSTDRRHRNNG